MQALLRAETGALVLPAPMTAEVDYLLGERFGEGARRAFLADLAAGDYVVDCLRPSEYATVAQLDAQYESVGLADLSLVVAASRLRTTRIATFDERHLRTLRPLQGGSFTLLPADA